MTRGWLLGVVVAALWAAPAAAAPQWLAGDGHVHTCYSHDAWCGPHVDDDPIEPNFDDPEDSQYPAFYSFGATVAERFNEAAAKGLQFLVISDHDNIKAWDDTDWGTAGVTGVHAYEASIRGHAQIMGALRRYDPGDEGAAAIDAMADALRVDGGVFQANHPGYRLTGEPLASCEETTGERMNWRYGFQVLPDTVEVWNATTLVAPSELYWECWLQRGARIGALGASDSHGANHVNLGFPMTWAYAESAGERDILAALRAGRTTLSRVAPRQGAVKLLLEGDRDRDGTFEAMIGDEVPPNSPLRVRAEGLTGPGIVRVRANGDDLTVTPETLSPGETIDFVAPAEPGWVRATLYLRDGTAALDPGCEPPEDPPLSTCSEDLAVASMTSPIWVGPAAAAPKVDAPGPAPPLAPGPEPDSQSPLPPEPRQAMPNVPPQRGKAGRVRRLRATWFRGRRSARSQNVRLRWNSPEGPWQVQARRPGGKWRSLAARTRRRAIVVRLNRGNWVFRVRARPPLATASGWRSVNIRL